MASVLNAHSGFHHHPIPLRAEDGARSALLMTIPPNPIIGLLFIPALGVPARHYERLATALASRGIAVARHEWRGIGSSSLRAGRDNDWGYRELHADIADSLAAAQAAAPGIRWLVGGHSLGSQFAAMAFAVHDQRIDGLVVIAGGMPYWKNFPGLRGMGIRALFALAPRFARWHGHFPGRRFGFGGNEARGVMHDWSETGRSGNYTLCKATNNVEVALSRRSGSLLGIWLDEDWFTPRKSFDHLLDKLSSAAATRITLSRGDFAGCAADHFGWINEPEPIAQTIESWIASNPRLTSENS